VPCQHLLGNSCQNCGIYATRPPVCRDYACMWLAGHGSEDDRPDRCGVMVDSMTPVSNALRGVPLRAGAQDTVRGQLAVERISRSDGRPVMVCEYPETRLLRVVGRGAE